LIGDNLIAGHDGRPLRPINTNVAQPTPIHFFSKFIGVSLHVVACKPIATARLLIRFDLPPDAAKDLLLRVATRCDATILLARDPWHDGLPLRGLRRVRDAESGRSRLLYFGARERECYARAVAARDKQLTAQFVNAGWRVGELDEADGRASLERAFGLPAAPRHAR